MYLGLALFESLSADGSAETFLIFPTDAPTIPVDRLRDVRGMVRDQAVDLGPLRFYAAEEGLKIRRVAAEYGPPVFNRHQDRISIELEHVSLPIAENTMGYYSLLLPSNYAGHVHASSKGDLHWLTDTRRMLVSIPLLDRSGYVTKSVHVHADLSASVEPDSHIPRIQSTSVYADWSTGPHHNIVRHFLRAANASLSDTGPQLFICHSHQDKTFARKLAIALASVGIKVWLDEAEIRVGESLIGKIESGITGATHLVAIISKDAVASRWCQEELRMAMVRQIGGRTMTVLPALIDDCEIPGFLQEKLYADFRDRRRFEDGVRLLTEAVSR